MPRPKKFKEEKPVENEKIEQTKTEEKKVEETKEPESKPKLIVVEETDAKKMAKQKLKKLIEEETKLVEGVFRNYETPGASSRIQIAKYPGIPMFDKTMMDGQTYKVPLYVARHLNGYDKSAEHIEGKVHTCSYPVHGFKWDTSQPMPRAGEGCGPSGEPGIPVPIIGVQKWQRRFGFESMEFRTSE